PPRGRGWPGRVARRVQRADAGPAGAGLHRRRELPGRRAAGARRRGDHRARRGAHRRGVRIDPLDGIELVVFDKDGTLIEFHRMWRGWVHDLATQLEGATGLPLEALLCAVMGVDPASGEIAPHGLLAATPMSRIRAVVVAALVEEGLEP